MKNILATFLIFFTAIYACAIGGTGNAPWKNVTIDGRRTAVFSTMRDSRGLLWVGTNGGLYIYDGSTAHAVSRDKLGGVQIYSIVEFGDKLFLGTNHGLATVDINTGSVSWEASQPKEIRALMADAAGHLWIASLEGIWHYDVTDGTLTDASAGLPHPSAYALLLDSRGIIYAGTYGGPARFDAAKDTFVPLTVSAEGKHYPTLFANALIESADGSCIYMGTEGALFSYTPATDSWQRLHAMDNYTVKSLARAADDRIVAGTDDGILVLDGNAISAIYRHDSRRDQSLADNEIWTVAVDADNNILAGHERGFSIATSNDAIRTLRLGTITNTGDGCDIYVILRDSHGNLWFGGSNGIVCLGTDGRSRWYRHTGTASGVSHKRIRAIMEGRNGDIWLATDGGIDRLQRGGDTFDVYHVADSTGTHVSNWVYSLAEDATGIWTGSYLGGLMHAPASALTRGSNSVTADIAINSGNTPAMANDLINEVVSDGKGNLWISLYRAGSLMRFDTHSGAIDTIDIRAITGENPSRMCVDDAGRLWCAFTGGVAVVDSAMQATTLRLPGTGNDESALAIAAVGPDVWLSTLSSVWSFDGRTLAHKLLPLPQKAYTAIYDDSAAGGGVLLGAADELLEVDRDRLTHTSTQNLISLVLRNNDDGSINTAATDLTRGFSIPYGGNLSLQVSDLDYSPERVHRYMYRLADSATDSVGAWMVLPEGANTIAFSDLKPGNYSLLIRTAGSTAPLMAIPVHVQWSKALSWWAITLYIIALLGIICALVWYVRRRHHRATQERERTAALENVERKLSFLSTISHDLKTPLSLILGPASILREHATDAESRRALDTIYDNAVRLNGMIHRTLELQHIEDADSSMLMPTTFDAAEFCRSIFDVFREGNPQKNFVFTAPEQRIVVETDAQKLESVVTNLLSNACKYSDDGATISMGLARHDDRLEMVVSDDGVGIADIDQPLVFQRSFRAPATAQVKEGTGLGLFLIKKYLELMGGNIELYSRRGQGTAFIVTLPCSDKELPALAQAVPAGADKPKVLIVEDNIQISNFLATLLGADYTCLTADNGRAGLTIASSFDPDIIIADEMMPVMSGMDMVRNLKQNPRLQNTPIIMLTAKTDNRTEAESVSAGVDVFMAKPFEPEVLTGRIRRLLKARAEIRQRLRARAITQAQEQTIDAETPVEKQLALIAKVIEEHISDPDLNVNMLCEKTGIANKQLYRILTKYMDLAPLDYIRTVRLQKAAALLVQHRFTVSEVCYMTGFKTPSYFARCFREQYGCTPTNYNPEEEQ